AADHDDHHAAAADDHHDLDDDEHHVDDDHDAAVDHDDHHAAADDDQHHVDDDHDAAADHDDHHAGRHALPIRADGAQRVRAQLTWNRQFGGAGVFDAAHAMAVATDPSGNVVVAGSFEGTVNFGTGPMTSSGFKDVFVAKYSAAGVPLWAKAYGEPNDDEEA